MSVEIPIEKVETLAAQGLSMKQIALSIGIARSTLYKRQGEESAISDAIERGRAKGLAVICNALFAKAKDGDVSAIKFYLINRGAEHWKERRAVTVEDSRRSVVEHSLEELTAMLPDRSEAA